MSKKINNKKTTQLSSHRVKKVEKVNFFENNQVIYLLLGLAVLFVIIARTHLLSFPLERDEGEYAYMGRLILDGHAPYVLAYNMKYPGTYYMYAGIMALFGQSTIGIHLGLLIVTVASMILMFFISQHFVSKIGAVMATTLFGIMGTSWGLLGQAAHATHFVVFFALLGIYFLLQTYKNDKYKALKYLLSGIFFSFAFICKQSGLFFVFFAYTVILIKEFSLKPLRIPWKNLLLITSGFVAPVLLMFFAFYVFGVFEKFWFWTYTYLSKYGSQVLISDAFKAFKDGALSITTGGYTILWVIAVIAVPMIFATGKTTKEKLLILSFFLFSFLTIMPGFYFREHYFVTLLPVVTLLVALFFDFFNQLFAEKFKRPHFVFISFFVFLIIIGQGINLNKYYLFQGANEALCKLRYGMNPFVESIQIGEYLKRHSAPEDKIAILGSEPQILFYADRYSATGYIYTYNLMEIHSYAHSMQQEMIREIEQNSPKYFVFVNELYSWATRVDSDNTIFTWSNEYVNQHYRLCGYLKLLPDRIATLQTQLDDSPQLEEHAIYLFERREQE